MSFIYLASPYTPHNGESMESRVKAVTEATARLIIRTGCSIFSPIVHSHYVANHLPDDLRLDHEFWMRQDLGILAHANQLWILMLDGWHLSKGIQRETDYALEQRIPIRYVSKHLEILNTVPPYPRGTNRGRMGLGYEVGIA